MSSTVSSKWYSDQFSPSCLIAISTDSLNGGDSTPLTRFASIITARADVRREFSRGIRHARTSRVHSECLDSSALQPRSQLTSEENGRCFRLPNARPPIIVIAVLPCHNLAPMPSGGKNGLIILGSYKVVKAKGTDHVATAR